MSYSSLSAYDVITLKASFEHVFRLRCDAMIEEACLPRPQGKGYTRAVAEKEIRTLNGCNKISETPIYRIDDLEFFTCPCNFKNSLFNFLLTAQNAFEKGTMPYPGSLSEQPAKAIEALILLSNLKEEYLAEQRKKAQDKERSRSKKTRK